MENIKTTFEGIIEHLNQKGIRPIIYGSLGLNLELGTNLKANDIALIIEKPNEFSICKKVLEEMGFTIDPEHERELNRNGLYVSFLDKVDLEKLISEPLDVHESRINNSVFFNITPAQYLKIYTNGLAGEYRKAKREKDDLSKISLIKAYIGN